MTDMKSVIYGSRKATGGFTIVEVLVTLVILAVVAAITVPSLIDATARAKVSARLGNLSQLQEAVDRCRADTGAFPADLNSLTSAAAPDRGLDVAGNTIPITPGSWHGPYIESVPLDPVAGKKYLYGTIPPKVGLVMAPGPETKLETGATVITQNYGLGD